MHQNHLSVILVFLVQFELKVWNYNIIREKSQEVCVNLQHKWVDLILLLLRKYARNLISAYKSYITFDSFLTRMKPIRAPNKTSLKLWGKITEKHKESIWLAKSLCKCIFQVIANLGQRKGTSFLQLLDLLPTCGYEYYWKFTSKHWSKSFLKVFIEYFRRWFVKSGSQICWWYVLGVRFVGWPKKLGWSFQRYPTQP